MTKGEIFNMYIKLEQLNGLSGVKFAYAINRNKDILKPEYNAIVEAINPPKEYQEFINKKKKLELEKKPTKALESEYKKVIEDQKKREKEIEEMSKEEVDIKLHKISIDDVPENITVEQMGILLPIIK